MTFLAGRNCSAKALRQRSRLLRQEKQAMFPRIHTFAIVFSIIAILATSQLSAQLSRANVLRQAQARGERVVQDMTSRRGNVRLAQGSGTRMMPTSPTMNGSPVFDNQVSGGAPVVGGPSGAVTNRYVPQHLRSVAPTQDNIVIDGGSPIVSQEFMGQEIIDDGASGCGDPNCGGCGLGQSFFRGDICCNRNGGCGPHAWENCWIGCLGGLFNNAEFFAGAQGFRSRNFSAGTQSVDDSSFGFYGGVNMGLSLCRLACGLFSGQVGIRSSQSEFEGDFFSTDNRDQLFVTAGIFRRVDYGLQLGVVGDFMHEEWFAETELSQIRGDIGWVYPGGNTLGFRFASGTDDDTTNGIINGVAFDNLFAEVIDNYRFYYRMMAASGGHCDAYVGWSDADHAVFGLDFDLPVHRCWGMQSGFTYFLPEDTAPTVPTSTQDAWNVYVGVAYRPQGNQWYGNYDRPLFNVADNGTFVFGRN